MCLRFFHFASQTHLQASGVGGPFSIIFLEKILGDSRFFQKNFTKMAYLFESGYFKTFSFSQAESYNNIHKGFARNLPTICIPSCHAKILEYSHPPPPKKKKNTPCGKGLIIFIFSYMVEWLALFQTGIATMGTFIVGDLWEIIHKCMDLATLRNILPTLYV